MYEDIFDAKNACEHLSGFNVCNRYLVVLYYQPHKVLHTQILRCVSCTHTRGMFNHMNGLMHNYIGIQKHMYA